MTRQPRRPSFHELLASIPDPELRMAFARNECSDPWLEAMLRALGQPVRRVSIPVLLETGRVVYLDDAGVEVDGPVAAPSRGGS